MGEPLVIALWGDHGVYILVRGRETSYIRCDDADDPQHFKVHCWACDHQDELRTWPTIEEARQWGIENLGEDSMAHLPKDVVDRFEERIRLATDFSDLPLFGDGGTG